MSSSGYVRERLRPARVGPPVALVALPGCAVAADAGEAACVLGLGLVAVLVLRLWDDLADRSYDRRHFPRRVLPRLDSVQGYHVAVALGLGVVGLGIGDFRGWSVAMAWASLVAALAAWYGARNPDRRGWNAAVVLAKYPVLVLTLAPALLQSGWGCLVASAVYAFLLAYELLDDAALGGSGVRIPAR